MTDWHGQKAAETMRVPPVEGLKTPIGLHLGHVERLLMRDDPSYPSLVEAQRFGGIIRPHCVVRKGSGLQCLCGMVDDPKRHDRGLHKRRGLSHHRAQLEVDSFQVQLAGLDLGKIQDVVNERQQRFAGAADGLGVLALLRGQRGIE